MSETSCFECNQSKKILFLSVLGEGGRACLVCVCVGRRGEFFFCVLGEGGRAGLVCVCVGREGGVFFCVLGEEGTAGLGRSCFVKFIYCNVIE